MAQDGVRLPTTVKPTHYHVEMMASPERPAFAGKVTIKVEAEEEVDRIELHAADLEIGEARLRWKEMPGAGLLCDDELDEERERLVLELPEPMPAGPAVLSINFRGNVRHDMRGLYLSQDGDEVCLATQCEATDARRIFPCFDEPTFKARLEWSITTDPHYRVLANGPLLDRREDPASGNTTWEFGETRPISSYLAAFAVGNFASTDTVTRDDVPFEVWALGGKQDLGDHANNFAADLLSWYTDYFDVAYPYRKYDQLAVPSFSFGAMENVGLVVFRPSLLLMDETNSSWRQHKAVDRVVAHEFAHMWFGNLTTMAWWDDLWLNEAFAEWIAHKAVDELVPEHEVWFDFESRTSHALDTDALQSTHAIYHPVETPEEAVEMFDAITYGKGSAVMRMLEGFLTEEAFRAGLRSYMDAFAEANTRGRDLWDHLARASHRPVVEIMESWIGQGGHPVISFEPSDGETPEGTARVDLAQEHFLLDPSAEPSDQRWTVPVVLRYGDDAGVHERRALLDSESTTVDLDVEGELRWVHGNADNLGFYRTDPRGPLRERLVEHLQELAPLERVSFLRDQWDLVRSGRRDVAGFLDLLDALVQEEEHYGVIGEAVQRVGALEAMLQMADEEETLERLRAWTRERFQPHLETLGFTPEAAEGPKERQRRASVLRAVAAIGRDESAQERAVELADQEREDPSAVDANLAGLVLGVAARVGDEERYEDHLSEYKQRRAAHRPPQEVDRYMYSLAYFEPPELVERTCQAFLDELVPKQSVGPMLRLMLGEPHAQDTAWAFVTDEWDWLQENLGEAWVVNLVEAAGQLDPARRKEVVQFFEQNLDGSGQQAFGRTRERLRIRGQMHDRVVPDLRAWFQERA